MTELTLLADAKLAFHHVGLLTDRPDAAATALVAMGYQVTSPIDDPLQGVTLRMATGVSPTPSIEIITPTSGDSALGRLLRRRNDYMYHACFHVKSASLAIDLLSRAGLRVTEASPQTPAVLFDGRPVSFHIVEGLGLIELLEVGGVEQR